MNMLIPLFGDPSPDYANNITNDFTTLDAHDHSSGFGVQITPAGININQDLPFNNFNATAARSYRMIDNGSPLSTGPDQLCLYASGGDLYYNNSTGGQVQITAGGGLNAAATGGFGGDYVAAGAAANYDDTHKQYDFYQSGGSVFCDIQAANYSVFATAPYVEFAPTGSRRWRVGAGASDKRVVFSCDILGSGTVTGDQRFGDMVAGFTVQPCNNSAVAIASLGVYPDQFPLYGTTRSVGLGYSVGTGTYVNADFPDYVGGFNSDLGPAILGIAGNNGMAGNLSSPFVAGIYLGRTNGSTPDWGLGSFNSGPDFALLKQATGASNPSLFARYSNGFIGINNVTPADRLDVTGDIRATGGFRQTVGPFCLSEAMTTGGHATQAVMAISDAGGNVGFSAWGYVYVPMFAGSIVGMSACVVIFGSPPNNPIVATVLINGASSAATLTSAYPGGGNYSTASTTFAKDSITFSPGDTIEILIATTTGTSTSHPYLFWLEIEC